MISIGSTIVGLSIVGITAMGPTPTGTADCFYPSTGRIVQCVGPQFVEGGRYAGNPGAQVPVTDPKTWSQHERTNAQTERKHGKASPVG